MSPVAMWSSEWHMPDAASLTWSSPWRGSSAIRSTTSYLPGAERRIAPRVLTGTETSSSLACTAHDRAGHGMSQVTPGEARCNVRATPRCAGWQGEAVTGRPVVVVLERQPAPYGLPRAVHLDDEALRALADAGVAEDFLRVSRPMRGLRLLDGRGRVLAEFARSASSGPHGWPQASM